MLRKMFCPVIFAFCFLESVKADDKPKIHLPPDMAAKILPMAMNCVTETGVDPDILVKFIKVQPVKNEQYTNLIFCTLNKAGFVEDSGLIKVDVAVEAFPGSYKKEVRDVLEECNKVAESGDSPTDRVGKAYFCYMDKSPILLEF